MNIDELKFAIHEALQNLVTTKLRSFLAILGILVGTASVVAMISGGEMATRQALAQFKTLGTNLMSIQINPNQNSNANQKLALEVAENVKSSSSDIQEVAPYINAFSPVEFNGQILHASVLGVTNTFYSVSKLQTAKGRFISFLDHYENFAVIGDGLYQQIKQNSTSPILGQQIKLGSMYFTIIGRLKHTEQNNFIYADIDNSIMIPLRTTYLLSKYSDINSIILRVNPNSNTDILQQKVQNYFSNHAKGYELYIQSAKQLIDSMKKQQNILTVFLGFIGSIALLVGGIGVMNIMLVSVTERRREIGIRLAIGAKKKDIRRMFLIESIVLCLLGGFLGIVLGILVSFIIAEVKNWAFSIFFLPPLIGFSVSVLVGLFFGYYPAYLASNLDPIHTLRSE